jgi:hypothetical protein
MDQTKVPSPALIHLPFKFPLSDIPQEMDTVQQNIRTVNKILSHLENNPSATVLTFLLAGNCPTTNPLLQLNSLTEL